MTQCWLYFQHWLPRTVVAYKWHWQYFSRAYRLLLISTNNNKSQQEKSFSFRKAMEFFHVSRKKAEEGGKRAKNLVAAWWQECRQESFCLQRFSSKTECLSFNTSPTTPIMLWTITFLPSIPFCRVFASWTAHFHGYYSNSVPVFLLLFCWLIETDLRKENFWLGFTLIWVSFSLFIFTRDGHKAGREKGEKPRKIKKQSKSSCAICHIPFSLQIFSKLVEISGTSAKINVKPLCVSISQASRVCVQSLGHWRDKWRKMSDLQYIYQKERKQFGKQCLFQDKKFLMVSIPSNHDEFNDYILRNPVSEGTQLSRQFALSEVNTTSTTTESRGILHTEGGWPKDVNYQDSEQTLRYRRKLEKDDTYITQVLTPGSGSSRFFLIFFSRFSGATDGRGEWKIYVRN